MADGKISLEFDVKNATAAHSSLDAVKTKAKTQEVSTTAAERETRALQQGAQASRNIAQNLNRGNVAVGGMKQNLAVSGETFSASINAAAIVLTTAAGSLSDSSNSLLSAASRVAGISGMGWGIGSMFGQRGGIIGATFATVYGLTSIGLEYLRGHDPESIKEAEDEAKRWAEARKKRIYEKYRELDFQKTLDETNTVESAKDLKKSLQEELQNLTRDIEAGVSNDFKEFKNLKRRIEEVQNLESELEVKEAAEKGAKYRTNVERLELDATKKADAADKAAQFEAATTEQKIQMLQADIARNKQIIEEERKAFDSRSMTDEQFEWHKNRFNAANDAILSAQKDVATYQRELAEEKAEAEKTARENAVKAQEERNREVADEYNEAFKAYAATGSNLQRAGVFVGGASSTQLRIAQLTADNVKSIAEMFRSGDAKVTTTNDSAVITA